MSESKEVPNWLIRLYDEEVNLKDKIEKLTAFFSSELYKGLSEEHQSLLRSQLSAMRMYHAVLHRRIVLHDAVLFPNEVAAVESIVDTEVVEDQSPAVEAEDVNQEHGM